MKTDIGSRQISERTDRALCDFVLGSLPYDRTKTATSAALQAMSGKQLLNIYLNWFFRSVPQFPRKIRFSNRVLLDELNHAERKALQEICRAIENGDSLQRYLSRAVLCGYEKPKGKKKKLAHRRDLDLLFNETCIHHLHLSSEVEEDGFVQRTDRLLFVLFRREFAYLINILPHQANHLWADRELFRTIVENWPTENLLFELVGCMGEPQSDRDDQQDAYRHIQLRNAGVMTSISLDDKVYCGAGALSTAGTSMLTLRWSNEIVPKVNWLFEMWEQKPASLRSELLAKGHFISPDERLAFQINPDGVFGLHASDAQVFISVGQIQL
ncbi:hypothetical protein [Thalassospira povalilytica]|uniref:hypothetical protein n=1 Tax=Thalassospira povalilytica TaxID=732237 RepID=UPI003AA8556F